MLGRGDRGDTQGGGRSVWPGLEVGGTWHTKILPGSKRGMARIIHVNEGGQEAIGKSMQPSAVPKILFCVSEPKEGEGEWHLKYMFSKDCSD